MAIILKKLLALVMSVKGHGIGVVVGNKVLAIVITASLVTSATVMNSIMNPSNDSGMFDNDVHSEPNYEAEKDHFVKNSHLDETAVTEGEGESDALSLVSPPAKNESANNDNTVINTGNKSDPDTADTESKNNENSNAGNNSGINEKVLDAENGKNAGIDADNAAIRAAKAAIENTVFTAALSEADDAVKAKAKVQKIIDGLDLDVSAVIVPGIYIPAGAKTGGDSTIIDTIDIDSNSGSKIKDGSFEFKVTLNRGLGTEQTASGTLIITARKIINNMFYDYIVEFVDWDGTELSFQGVNHGSDAAAPDDPEREGHTFTGWDVDFLNVTDDMTVTAQYGINKYTVWFLDWEGKGFSSEDIEHGQALKLYRGFNREGHKFIGWDDGTTFIKGSPTVIITSDMTFTAVYEADKLGVGFYDWDFTHLTFQLVDYGSDAIAPPDPVREGYIFIGWEIDFRNVTDALTVIALYEEIK